MTFLVQSYLALETFLSFEHVTKTQIGYRPLFQIIVLDVCRIITNNMPCSGILCSSRRRILQLYDSRQNISEVSQPRPASQRLQEKIFKWGEGHNKIQKSLRQWNFVGDTHHGNTVENHWLGALCNTRVSKIILSDFTIIIIMYTYYRHTYYDGLQVQSFLNPHVQVEYGFCITPLSSGYHKRSIFCRFPPHSAIYIYNL